MTSAYRNNLGAAEELLARLEAAHVERQVRRLREQRDVTASAPRPPLSFWGHVLRGLALVVVFVGSPALLLKADHAVSARWPYVEMPDAATGVASLFGPLLVVAVLLKYFAWHNQRARRMALAKLDAKISTIENAPRRIELSTLGEARVRIAELEAEEASAADDASPATPGEHRDMLRFRRHAPRRSRYVQDRSWVRSSLQDRSCAGPVLGS